MNADKRIAYHLPTPCGSITVRDEKNSYYPFIVRPSHFATAFEADSGRVYNTPHKYIITIPASWLEKGMIYRIALDGMRLGVGSTDECCFSVVGSDAGSSIAIGAADPNEQEKYRQFVLRRTPEEPPYTITAEFDYDRSSFVRYDLRILPDRSGFGFELLDDSCDEIAFPVAWIASPPGLERETEDAVQFWVL